MNVDHAIILPLRRRLCVLLLALVGSLIPSAAGAQGTARAFSIFLDCSGFYCESDFYRTDIGFVDHVRERTAADVHVLITRETTGGGGGAFVLAFYGQQRFAGVTDTLRATTAQGATEDERRKTISRTVKLGLARYLARTGDAARTSVTVSAPVAGDTAVAAKRDPWNAWVFRVSANLNENRERDYLSRNIFSSFNASRVTEQWKTNTRVYNSSNLQKFIIDSTELKSKRDDYGGSLLQVRSLSDHWSAGARADAGSSTFLNQGLFLSAAPAVEYNVYPYRESTRHTLSFLYSVGVKHFRYNDTTVFFKIRETRPFESLAINLAQKEKWGSVNLEVSGYHFLDDLGKSRLSISPEAEVRILKGLSLNLFANYAVLHDQLYLSKGDATPEEVLLRQSQLATTYRSFIYMGLSYTFGSVLNNVVNPRFGGSDGF